MYYCNDAEGLVDKYRVNNGDSELNVDYKKMQDLGILLEDLKNTTVNGYEYLLDEYLKAKIKCVPYELLLQGQGGLMTKDAIKAALHGGEIFDVDKVSLANTVLSSSAGLADVIWQMLIDNGILVQEYQHIDFTDGRYSDVKIGEATFNFSNVARINFDTSTGGLDINDRVIAYGDDL